MTDKKPRNKKHKCKEGKNKKGCSKCNYNKKRNL